MGVDTEVAISKLNELGDFGDLIPALLAQFDFLARRPQMLIQDLDDPDRLISSMSYEIAETFKPRMGLEYGDVSDKKENAKELASESADVVVFAVSAMLAKEDWDPNELNLIKDSLIYAKELATIGGFDLGNAAVYKIREVNEKHYPELLFGQGVSYMMSRRVCKALRVFFGSNFLNEMGMDGVVEFLRDIASSDDGRIPEKWSVSENLVHEEYLKFKEASQQLVGVLGNLS